MTNGDVAIRLQAGSWNLAAARAAIRALVADHPGSGETPEVAALLMTELLTNALLHAEPPIEVRARVEDSTSTLHVTVHDGSPEVPTIRDPAANGSGGYGLHVVEALASAWGVDPSPTGKDVWFRLDLQAPRPSDG